MAYRDGERVVMPSHPLRRLRQAGAYVLFFCIYATPWMVANLLWSDYSTPLAMVMILILVGVSVRSWFRWRHQIRAAREHS